MAGRSSMPKPPMGGTSGQNILQGLQQMAQPPGAGGAAPVMPLGGAIGGNGSPAPMNAPVGMGQGAAPSPMSMPLPVRMPKGRTKTKGGKAKPKVTKKGNK